MKLLNKLCLGLGIMSVFIFSNTVNAQRHSGAVVTIGVRKNFFSLTEVSGDKMKDFKGNIAPSLGISYAHVLGRKFSATYEFDFSFLKGTYTELYNPTYEYYPITDPYNEEQEMEIAPRAFETKNATLTINLMAHYRLVKGFFVSGGFGYDRYMTVNKMEPSLMYEPKIRSEIRDLSYNINLTAGIGYSTDKFRFDLRYSAGLINLIEPEKNRYVLEYWRNDKLKLSKLSLTFGYFLGKK